MHSGHATGSNQIHYPFNVQMNINHEYWHLAEAPSLRHGNRLR